MSKKTYSAQQRFLIVKQVIEKTIQDGCSLDEACTSIGVARTTFTRWRNKLRANRVYLDKEEIPEKSRRPHHQARKISERTRQLVIDEAGKPGQTSANKIHKQLKEGDVIISVAKVIEILREEGLYGEIRITNTKGKLIRKRGLLKLDESHYHTNQKIE